MRRPRPKIVAPVCSADEALQALDAGADELYCGVMFDDWVETFGDSDLLTRRQGREAHVRAPGELLSLMRVARQVEAPIALTLNVRYSNLQEERILDLAKLWEDLGGTAVLVSDIGILIGLEERGSTLDRHLSTLAGVFNGSAVSFFRELGISRLVLPRELSLLEIDSLARTAPDLELEAIAMYQKCQFIDAFCLFHHAVRYPDAVPASFDYASKTGESIPIAESVDPGYEGHGCQLPFETGAGPVRHLLKDDCQTPHCAACMLQELWKSGIGYFKIAGRAYPPEVLARAIRFLREVVTLLMDLSTPEVISLIVQLCYQESFGSSCKPNLCYYSKS